MQASKNVDYYLTIGRTKQMNNKIRRSSKQQNLMAVKEKDAKKSQNGNLDRRRSISDESIFRPPLKTRNNKEFNKGGALFGLIKSTIGADVYRQVRHTLL